MRLVVGAVLVLGCGGSKPAERRAGTPPPPPSDTAIDALLSPDAPAPSSSADPEPPIREGEHAGAAGSAPFIGAHGSSGVYRSDRMAVGEYSDAPAPPYEPNIRIERVTAPASLSQDAVRDVLEAAGARFLACYHEVADVTKSTTMSGTVDVKLELGPNGHVTSSSGTGMRYQVDQCTAAVLRKLTFPAPSDGAPAKVTASVRYRANK